MQLSKSTMLFNLSILWSIFLITGSIAAESTQQSFSEDESRPLTFEEETNKSLLWAPYRSNCYFGIRPRYVDETPFMLGVMWFDTSKFDSMTRLRHIASNDDNLEKFSWEIYDPRLGGRENIIDRENNLNLTIHFAKTHDDENWVVRVSGQPLDASLNTTASIVVYMNQNTGTQGETGSRLMHAADEGDENNFIFTGISNDLGPYEILINDNYGEYFVNETIGNMEIVPGADSSKTSHISMNVPDDEVWRARDIFQSLLSDSIKDIVNVVGDNIDQGLVPSVLTLRNIHQFGEGNFHYIQKTFDNRQEKGFQFDLVYNNLESSQMINSRNEVTQLISSALDEVQTRFNKHFDIEDSKSDEKHAFALETLSNLLGGVGYFHGSQIIDRQTVLDEDQFEELKLEHGSEEGPFSLFTSVPSRGFFPRGFYWDEGFHLLQIMEYDFDLAFQIAISWFQLIDENGWVAREVILGAEGRSKVPGEFTVQSPQIANPPTLLLAFSEMLNKVLENEDNMNFSNLETDEEDDVLGDILGTNREFILKYSKTVYPKLMRHFEWFTETQRGLIDEYADDLEDDEHFNKIHKDQVYRWLGRTSKHCLPSGLDDFPRVQPPDIAELDVDTLTWVGVFARSMKNIAHLLENEKDVAKFKTIEKKIVENLDLVHWSEKQKTYCDVTMDEDDEEEEMSLVCHEGYISLLPFALKLMPRDSPKLKYIIDLMSDPERLFSEYGLLSLSKKDEYFGKDENYWRGKVWLNINYLCLDALKFYFPEIITGHSAGGVSHDKKLVQQAKKLHDELRANLITNVYNVWKDTGYVYENYSPVDGQGSGSKGFTGWTSLIVNILRRQL